MVQTKPEAFWQKLRLTPLIKVALLVAVSLHLLGFLLLQVTFPPEPGKIFPKSFLQFLDAEKEGHYSLLREQAELFDSAPLFLPTFWNYASNLNNLALSDESEAPLFESFPAVISLYDESLQVISGVTAFKINQPRDALKSKYWNFFSTFGQEEKPPIKMPGRTGYMEIQDLSSAQVLLQKPILSEDEELAGLSFWLPVVFQVTIDNLGPVGLPLMLQGSGVDKVDRAFRAYLMQPAVLAAFPPGYYKITIGP